MTSDTVSSIRSGLRRIVDGDSTTHIGIKKHRTKFLIVSGTLLLFTVFTLALCIGPTKCINTVDAYAYLFSAIGQGGMDLTNSEIMVYSSRLPRALEAIAVGIGLSVAGAAYQAVIRNPLVDPYIMGVSSGAGTLAIAAMAFDFTFFGLISSHSPYLVAVCSIVGGLAAFFITMILAQVAGATTNSYVLAGVIVGLTFGAAQTVMIVFSNDAISNVMLWLFGTFSDLNMTKVICTIIPVAILSLLISKYAKELNLVLLGEGQAAQMGLNVKRFNMVMLILASILASFCVGFVGLVIPHLCRMIFGGDHRLIIPASIMFGGSLMLLADLVARMAVSGMELPVGAITTIIGVPVFAYLLYKKGKIYNG